MRKMHHIILVAVVLLGLTGIHQAFAFELTTEVTNHSGSLAIVDIYAKGATEPASLYNHLSIPDHATGSATFLSLTGICPSHITGNVGSALITPMNCSGVENGSTSARCCGNLKFNIVRKQDPPQPRSKEKFIKHAHL